MIGNQNTLISECMQVTYECRPPLRYRGMAQRKVDGIRVVFAQNVMRRVYARWPGIKSEEQGLRKLAVATGISISTLRRIVRPETYSHETTIVRADEIARGLRCETYELFQDAAPDEASD